MTTVLEIGEFLRSRRLRINSKLRGILQEYTVLKKDLCMPLFIKESINQKVPIISMPGLYQLSLNDLECEIKELLKLGITSVLLFGIPENKDPYGSSAVDEEGIVQKACRMIKKITQDILVITDLCFCEYTDHGHCGILNTEAVLDNDLTLVELCRQALSHARAGADIIAPSGMLDGMVIELRRALDESGFNYMPIMSYSAKYASCMYGPFREAAEGSPLFGDRRTHQIDPANLMEALKEASADISEGADIIMVKPAHTYLDVIRKIKDSYPMTPLAAYHTSGEFAMIKCAAKMGLVDEKSAVKEVLTSIKRAGADIIITYFAKAYAEVLSYQT
jgi:porphobilinogen synthase